MGKMMRALLLILLVNTAGASWAHFHDGFDWLDGFYWAFITSTSVGFGDLETSDLWGCFSCRGHLGALVGDVFLLSLAHPLEEGDEWHESIIVSGVTELLHQALGVLLAQLLSEVGEELEELVLNDGVVVVFVVQLHDLNKVVEASLVLGVLAGLEHGEDFVLAEHFTSLFCGSSDGSDGLEGWVDVAGPHEVADVEGVDLAVSLEVVDIEGEVDCLDFLLLESKLG